MKKKTFDCVEMKRRGAKRVQEETAGMTREEKIAYWDRATQEMLARQEELRKQAGAK